MVLKLTCQAEKESGLTYIYEHKLEEVLSLSSQDSLRSTKQYRWAKNDVFFRLDKFYCIFCQAVFGGEEMCP